MTPTSWRRSLLPWRRRLHLLHLLTAARLRLLLVDTEPVAPIIPLRTPRRNLASRVRHPVAAAAVVVILATSSAAAAAVGTDTLPGPLRTVAVSLGLPVPSPALNTARGAMAMLAAALGYGDEGAIARDLTALQVALSKLDPADLASVKEAADQLVDRAELALASGPAKSGAESGRGVRGGSTQPRSSGAPPVMDGVGAAKAHRAIRAHRRREATPTRATAGRGEDPDPRALRAEVPRARVPAAVVLGPQRPAEAHREPTVTPKVRRHPCRGHPACRVTAVGHPPVVPRAVVQMGPVPMEAARHRPDRAPVVREVEAVAALVTAAVAPGDAAPSLSLTAPSPHVDRRNSNHRVTPASLERLKG